MGMHMGKITSAKNWEAPELSQVIALYFLFIANQLAGVKVVKSHHYKPLAESLGRSIGSIESKLMNISACLKFHKRSDLIVKGYKPLNNFSTDMLEAVEISIISLFKKVA